MLTRFAAIILAASLTALAVVGVTGVARSDPDGSRERHRSRRHVQAGHNPAVAPATYVFAASGDALGKFPWGARAELDLRDQGRYELRVKVDMKDNVESETSWGRYTVHGNRVTLYHGDGDSHDLTLRGDRLEFDGHFKTKLLLKAIGIEDPAFARVR